MTGRVDADIRAYKAIIAYGDWGFVEHGKVEVGKEPFAHTDLLAVVAIEGLDDQYLIVGNVSQETFQDLPCLLLLRRAQQVIVVDYLLHFRQLFNQPWVNGGINLARQHLFFFCHIILVF